MLWKLNHEVAGEKEKDLGGRKESRRVFRMRSRC